MRIKSTDYPDIIEGDIFLKIITGLINLLKQI